MTSMVATTLYVEVMRAPVEWGQVLIAAGVVIAAAGLGCLLGYLCDRWTD